MLVSNDEQVSSQQGRSEFHIVFPRTSIVLSPLLIRSRGNAGNPGTGVLPRIAHARKLELSQLRLAISAMAGRVVGAVRGWWSVRHRWPRRASLGLGQEMRCRTSCVER